MLTATQEKRIRRDGSWVTFEATRDQLMEENLSVEDATTQALAEIEGNVPDDIGEESSKLPGWKKSDFPNWESINLRDAVEWAFDYVDIIDVAPKDAPSPGAWSFLMWVRQNVATRAQFYKTNVTRLMPTRSTLDKETAFSDDGKAIRADIDLLLRQAGEKAVGTKKKGK